MQEVYKDIVTNLYDSYHSADAADKFRSFCILIVTGIKNDVIVDFDDLMGINNWFDAAWLTYQLFETRFQVCGTPNEEQETLCAAIQKAAIKSPYMGVASCLNKLGDVVDEVYPEISQRVQNA